MLIWELAPNMEFQAFPRQHLPKFGKGLLGYQKFNRGWLNLYLQLFFKIWSIQWSTGSACGGFFILRFNKTLSTKSCHCKLYHSLIVRWIIPIHRSSWQIIPIHWEINNKLPDAWGILKWYMIFQKPYLGHVYFYSIYTCFGC